MISIADLESMYGIECNDCHQNFIELVEHERPQNNAENAQAPEHQGINVDQHRDPDESHSENSQIESGSM